MIAPRTSRRSMFSGAALAVFSTVADAAQLAHHHERQPTASASHPDAELIALCEQHSVNRDALNNGPGTMNEDEPEWLAYRASLEAISGAKPQTMAGLVAKAHAAKGEARNPDGTESFDLYPVCDWTWDLADDLLRLALHRQRGKIA